MKRIAICGNIASGKSTVQKFIEEKGFKVIDTDNIAHLLLTVKNKELYDAFKNFDVFDNGEFSRLKMGDLIFSNNNLRLKLNSILHPQIANKIKEFYDNNINEKIVFVGIPLLFEAKMEYLFDKIIFIYTSDEIRLERLIKRNKYNVEQAKNRIESQISQEEKKNKSDIIIYNNDTREKLKHQVDKMISSLV